MMLGNNSLGCRDGLWAVLLCVAAVGCGTEEDALYGLEESVFEESELNNDSINESTDLNSDLNIGPSHQKSRKDSDGITQGALAKPNTSSSTAAAPAQHASNTAQRPQNPGAAALVRPPEVAGCIRLPGLTAHTNTCDACMEFGTLDNQDRYANSVYAKIAITVFKMPVKVQSATCKAYQKFYAREICIPTRTATAPWCNESGLPSIANLPSVEPPAPPVPAPVEVTGPHTPFSICPPGQTMTDPSHVINMLYVGVGTCRQHDAQARAGKIFSHLGSVYRYFAGGSGGPCGCK